MYIKEITISGFRSYHMTQTLRELSPKQTAIVGPNGSGKTNVLFSIQFVFSDEFNGLNANQRQQLINDLNSGQRLLTAFVELVVDNSDRRMPLDSNEIRFRRQIGLKKDQYFVNNKIINHSDIVNLLETAGFSRSNPYYIVKQGCVNEMALASNEHRLQVMREVAGTRIYDERKRDALKLLSESRQRSEQIDDCLKSLAERVSNLEIESKDLNAFLKWDKRRRLLEYIIVSKESESTKNQIQKLEAKQEEENQLLDNKHKKLEEIQHKFRTAEKRLKVICGLLEEYRKDMNQLNESIDELNERKARIESKISDFREKLNFNKENDLKVNEELKDVIESIDIKRNKLIGINRKYEELRKKENQLNMDLSGKQSRKVELYSKLKRKESFRSIDERNRWIRSELQRLEKEIQTNEKRIADLKTEESEMFEKKSQLENEQNGFQSEEKNLIMSLQNEKKELFEMTKDIKRLETKRSELWDSENRLKESQLKSNEEKMKIESKLLKLSGTSATIGRESVRKVLELWEQKASNSSEDERRYRPLIDGYLGQVIDCFSFDANLSKAVEVTAKSKLFYHIVINDKIGTKIIAEVNEKRLLGEITFIAINKLIVKTPKYPELENNARPLTTLIKYDSKYNKVMEYLFSRTLVCRNLELASNFARSARLDCTTIDGDFVSHKGLMSGGYLGSDTRMEAFLKWKTTFANIESIREKLIENRRLNEANESELAAKTSLLSTFDIKYNKTKRKLENFKTSKDRIRHQLVDLNRKLESVGRSIATLESTLPSMRASRDSFDSELGLSLDSQLSSSEQKELEVIAERIERICNELSDVCRRRTRLGAEKRDLESNLEQNLEQRKNELEFHLIDSKISETEGMDLETESLELDSIDRKIDEMRKELIERNAKIDDLVRQQNDIKVLFDNLKSAEDKQNEIIESELKISRKISTKLNNFEKKNTDCMKRLRSFGTIPMDLDLEQNYQNMSLSDEYKTLKKCKQKISKLNVNQKALDQLSEGQEKGLLLTAEKRDIDLGYQSIEQLIQSLEHRKYEAIQMTYRQVSKFFEQIFRQFVPEGRAFLDMIYSDTGNGSSASGSHGSQTSQSSGAISTTGQSLPLNQIDNFVGVKIRVSFTGSAIIQELNQLSGGQKSVVALAFIFAIQKCDPAPFYLFDEVDQALDPIYRKTLSHIIKDRSKTSQFITTTFRPELLESAEKFFAVRAINRISRIEEISAELAKDFIETEADITADKSRKSVRFDTSADKSGQKRKN